MSNVEHEIRTKLAEVPAVPSDLFEDITCCIARRKKIAARVRTIAGVLLILGIFGYNNIERSTDQITYPNTQTEEAVGDELQIIHDYLNGEDVEMELEEYAVLDPVLFPDHQ